MMKLVVLGFAAIFAVALASENAPVKVVINEEAVLNHQDHLSLTIRMVDEKQQYVDENVMLEGILARNLVVEMILRLLEDFRDVVINGNEMFPPLDPMEIASVGPIEMQMTGVRATATIKNIRAEGLRWYVVDFVNFNALRLTFGTHITLPWLTVTGSYDAEARVALLLTHKAGGNFRVFINRFEVGVAVRMGTNIFAGKLFLRELDIKLDIADTFIQIDGMTGSSIVNSAISAFVQNLSQDIIQTHLDDISQLISEEVFDAVNDFLKDFSLSDLTR